MNWTDDFKKNLSDLQTGGRLSQTGGNMLTNEQRFYIRASAGHHRNVAEKLCQLRQVHSVKGDPLLSAAATYSEKAAETLEKWLVLESQSK